MNEPCGCCERPEPLTPISTANRPGLDALVYRVGTHATFLETMKARLSSSDFPSLVNLKTRDASDPAIAFLDAWATVADVLTFYQERIANEGYLRTATERRSILELAQLVGYTLRPGVAATVYPAFTMETGYNKGSEIPAGTRIQSLPGPGEMPQFFETSEKIEARANWNNLQPRLTRPHYITLEKAKTNDINRLYFQGISTNLKPNDPLLLVFGNGEGQQVFRHVQAVEPQAMENRTVVKLQASPEAKKNSNLAKESLQPEAASTSGTQGNKLDSEKKCPIEKLGSVVDGLLKPPSIPPANALRLALTPKDIYKCESDIAPQLLATLKPVLENTLHPAWANTALTEPSELQSTQALRVKAAPFGANAPRRPVYDDSGRLQGSEEWAIRGTMSLSVSLFSTRVGAVEGSPNLASVVARETFAQALISIMRDSATASTQIALSTQNYNFDASLGQTTVRVTILPTTQTRIRFIHALLGRGTVDIYIGDQQVATGISRFDTSDYLVAIVSNLQVKLAGQQDTLLSLDLTPIVQSGGAYSVIATGGVGTSPSPPEALAILREDTDRFGDNLSSLPSGRTRVRVINASPAPINVASLERLAIPIPLATSLDFRSSSNYTSINAGIYDLTVTLDNNQNIILSGITFESETVCDIILVGLVNGEPRLTVKIFNTPSQLVGELGRFVFKFLKLEREFRFIVDNAGVIAQVANGKLLTARFNPNQRQQYLSDGHTVTVEGGLTGGAFNLAISEEAPSPIPETLQNVLALDAQYDQITPGSWMVIERPAPEKPDGKERLIRQVMKTETLSKAAYGISARVTQVTLNDYWLKETDLTLDKLREITVYAQSEELKLAEEAIDPKEEPVKKNEMSEIELSDLYDGLQPGRWLIVSGERVDLGEKTTGVMASELVMLSGVTQRVAKVKNTEQDLPGDKTHTFLQLAKPLEYQYKRDTVTIYGNVVKATHGETRNEVLGSGDGSKAFQQFPLRQPPLTYLAAPTPAGAASTLAVRVNDILWHETDSLAGLKPSDRLYITKTDDDGKTTVIFGNGHNGLRPPTGVENIKAVYRSGIGKVGNVKAEQISLLATRPLGLKGVINPLPATGGADKESRDQARRNAPLAVMALDRLVSVQDYADFARTFAGIGKASATELSDGRRQLVYVTIAGADNIPIDKSSDLYRNLLQAFQEFGDPNQPIQVEIRELMLLLLVASIRILPDYQWESVEPRIRQRLLDTFSFERRELGQAVFLSEVISTIQQVPGVAYVDVDILDTVSETEAADPTKLVAKIQALTQNDVSPSGIQPSATGTDKPQDEKQPKNRIPVSLARVEPDAKKRFLPKPLIQPAQLAVLSPTVPLTLILNPVEVKP